MEYCWDCFDDDACVCFDEVYEELVVDCCIDLLDDGVFEEVEKVEFTHILIILTNGVLNLILCCTVYLRRGY